MASKGNIQLHYFPSSSIQPPLLGPAFLLQGNYLLLLATLDSSSVNAKLTLMCAKVPVWGFLVRQTGQLSQYVMPVTYMYMYTCTEPFLQSYL